MTILASLLICAVAWTPPWTEVTPANGVKDDYYPLPRDAADGSFRFRFSRTADNRIGVEAYVRDDRTVVDDCAPGAISCTTWTDDCLEVFFDGDGDGNPNTRGPDWNENPTPCNAGGEYAIAANGATQSDYASAKRCFGRLWGGYAEPWTEDGRRIGTHYDLWFGWECLNRSAPPPDEAVCLRATVCIHDDDDGRACDKALYWKGNPRYPFADESAFGTVTLPPVTETFTWGGVRAHPAVVNPVCGGSSDDVISLRGDWTFARPSKDLPHRNGPQWKQFYKAEWPETRVIRVPGCWEAQGVGEPGDSECWDPVWDNCAKPIRHKYMGEGFYRRDVRIPETWSGKRIWLKFGGVRAIGWVWVNGRQLALLDSYCATEKYEITDFVMPGETARIVIDVDNRKPSRKGFMSGLHRWGGIYRDVELEATPGCFIDDAWARGDFDRQVAEVHVELDGVGSAGSRLKVTVEDGTREIVLPTAPSTCALEIPLRNFRPWSPESPNLYTAKIELVENGDVVQTRYERFGVRKLEVRGKEFYLNGRPFYVRGFGDDHVYPLTGMTPADREVHRAHLRKAKAAGFNFVRLHTHCEVPEYFEAADETGIMIEAELPYYSDVPTEGFAFDPRRDVTELWRNFRRHPSFAVYSMGNEGSFGDSLDRAMHRYVKAMDPDRLKINQDTNRKDLSTPDRSDYAGGWITTWERGSDNPDRPFVTHEYLNLCVKSDSRAEGKYTGAWLPPATRKARGEWLARFGLGHDWGDRLQDAQHVLQAVWQKRGIESARLDPHCDGYVFWTIVDVVVWNPSAQAYSAQGLFDPFWDEKPKGLTAVDFAAFNAPTCVLADIVPKQDVFVSGDRFRAEVQLAHYGAEALRGVPLRWRLAADGQVLASGTLAVGDQPVGPVRKLGSVDVTIPEIAAPVKASLSVSVGESANAWDLWLFPKCRPLAEIRARARSLGVVIAAAGSAEEQAALAAGRPLVSVGDASGKPNVELGWWWMGPQVGTAIRPHPALGDFPHEGALTPLLFRILKKGKELPVADVRPEDMIIVGEGGEKCYLYLAERRIGGSRVIECHGLDVLSDLPEANALLDSFVDELAKKRKQ